MKCLQLTRVRVCDRCGRGRAELVAGDGTTLTVALDPARAAELRVSSDEPADLQSLSTVVLAGIAATGAVATDLVLDVDGTTLRALLSIAHGEETDVIICTPQEAVSLAVRGGLKLYATDEALAHQTARPTKVAAETLH